MEPIGRLRRVRIAVIVPLRVEPSHGHRGADHREVTRVSLLEQVHVGHDLLVRVDDLRMPEVNDQRPALLLGLGGVVPRRTEAKRGSSFLPD